MEMLPQLTATTAKRYSISAVASFASPSPSRMVRMRRGICIRRAIDNGATASGGETMAPTREADRPGQLQPQVAGRRHQHRGEQHAADRQQRNAAQVGAEVLPAHREGRR